MISRDSFLPHDTRNSMGTSGNVFESQPARDGPSSAFFEHPKNLASSSCGFLQYQLHDLPRIIQPGHLHIILEELTLKMVRRTSETPNLETPSREIPRLNGLSMLESQLQERSVRKHTLSYPHNVVDQRSGDSNLSRRSYDIAVN